MGFFKDFKQDLTQAVNELMPDGTELSEDKRNNDTIPEDDTEIEGNKTDDDTEDVYQIDLEDMNEILDNLARGLSDDADVVDESDALEEVYVEEEANSSDELDIVDEVDESDIVDEANVIIEDGNHKQSMDQEGELNDDIMENTDNIAQDDIVYDTTAQDVDEEAEAKVDTKEVSEKDTEITVEGDTNMDENIDKDLLDALVAEDEQKETKDADSVKLHAMDRATETSEACTIITKGTIINGSISSDGSLEINGDVTGDIECLGKLSITGKVVGNSMASEIFVNADRLDGNISSEGSVKIGLGTVLVGDVTANSGVIAGAVKGEIDVNGPVVIDSTAIIKGNIKAKSIQVNNGAVVEGFCSLSYASVDVDNIFGPNAEAKKNK